MPEETGVGTIVKIALVILVIVMSIFALKYARELLSPFRVTPEDEEKGKTVTQFTAFAEKLIEDVDVSCEEICTLTIKFTKKRYELLKPQEEILIIKINSREELKLGKGGGFISPITSFEIGSGKVTLNNVKKSAKFEVEVTKIRDEKIIAWDKVVVDANGKALVPELGWPVDAGRFLKLISCYGEQVVDGKKDFNYGINIEVPERTIVVASSSGFVVKTCEGTGTCGEFGNNILMQHANNLYTRYSHLSHIDKFDKEKQVSRSQRIGTSGPSLDLKVYTSAADVSGSKNGKNPLCFFPDGFKKKLKLPEGCKLPTKEECKFT